MTSAYLGDSGIVLSGPRDAEGVKWDWNGDDPWSPSPAPRDVSGENATDHGSWDATQFYGPRTIALEGHAHGTHEALHRAKHRLFAACGLGFTFRVVEPGFDRQAWVRRSGEILWSELSAHEGGAVARFSVPLWAGDPRVYSTTIRSASAGFPTSSGGLTWPATWPATWSAVIVSGELRARNDGDQVAWPVFRIDGPVTNPSIVNVSTGQVMHVDVVLEAGQWLTVDTGSHQVLADGDENASRRNLFWGDWFGLVPGASTIRFGGDSAGSGAQLSASWRDTYI